MATAAAAFLPIEVAARMADPAGTPSVVTGAWAQAGPEVHQLARILVLRRPLPRMPLLAGIRLEAQVEGMQRPAR